MRSLVPVCIAFAVLGATPCALAQGAQKPLAESLQGAAKDAYMSARILFNNNDFARALEKYKQAYDVSADPRLLYDMAICEKNLKHYARMQTLLQRYSKDEGSALTGEEKQIVDDALAATKNLVGAVHLEVNEPGASVSVDGEPDGVTPLPQALMLDLGLHKVTVTKPGFVSAEKELDVAGGSGASLSLTLTPETHVARLLVSTDPHATVSIDGTVVGQGRFEGSEAPGPHQVTVKSTGMRPYEAEIDLRDGEHRTLQVTLEAEKGHAPIWPWIVGGVAVAAGAAVGGYFLFKPSDTVTPIPAGKFASATFASWRP
jgi:hypothetical protein